MKGTVKNVFLVFFWESTWRNKENFESAEIKLNFNGKIIMGFRIFRQAQSFS